MFKIVRNAFRPLASRKLTIFAMRRLKPLEKRMYNYSYEPCPYEPCPFCKGHGITKCFDCGGLTRIYIGEKEYRCDSCHYGTVVCQFCDGSGKSHMGF